MTLSTHPNILQIFIVGCFLMVIHLVLVQEVLKRSFLLGELSNLKAKHELNSCRVIRREVPQYL